MSTTGQRLARIRKAAGYTQAELGNRSGVSQRLISNIELGQRDGTLETLQKIARALDVTVTHLTGEKAHQEAQDLGRSYVLRDAVAPEGLKSLARDDDLCQSLGITPHEWSALQCIVMPYPIGRDVYLAILHMLRSCQLRA